MIALLALVPAFSVVPLLSVVPALSPGTPVESAYNSEDAFRPPPLLPNTDQEPSLPRTPQVEEELIDLTLPPPHLFVSVCQSSQKSLIQRLLQNSCAISNRRESKKKYAGLRKQDKLSASSATSSSTQEHLARTIRAVVGINLRLLELLKEA
eukprot:IDg21441t1